MPVVDTHVHYWEPESPDRPYDAEGLRHRDPYAVENLIADMDAAGIDKTLQVTPTIMGYDNRYALEGAAKYPDRLRVFGRFDAMSPDVGRRLEGWLDQPYLVGIRLTLFSPASQKWLAEGVEAPFWREAEKRDIPVAVFVMGQVDQVGKVAERHPGLRLLLDHAGSRFGEKRFVDLPQVLALEKLPNVSVKVSGIPENSRERYPFRDVQPYLRQVYERFGAGRLMWGSDYPVSAPRGTLREMVDFVGEACDFIPAADRAEILGGTANRVLRLGW
jgi:L-fuconolactonase